MENIAGEFLYRLSHPLGEHVLSVGVLGYDCLPVEVSFDISNHPTRISMVENLKGQSGWMTLQHLHIDSFECEEYLLFSAVDDHGHNLDRRFCEKLFTCAGKTGLTVSVPGETEKRLKADNERYVKGTIVRNLEENNHHFSEARDRLDKWAEDMEMAAQKELDDTKRKIRELQRSCRQAATMEEQYSFQTGNHLAGT